MNAKLSSATVFPNANPVVLQYPDLELHIPQCFHAETPRWQQNKQLRFLN